MKSGGLGTHDPQVSASDVGAMVLSPGIYQPVDDAVRQPILRGGRNCWRIAHAERVAFLIDGADYFAAFAAAADCTVPPRLGLTRITLLYRMGRLDISRQRQ